VTATDKPRADLVALFDAVTTLPAMPEALRVDLTLHGTAAGAELRAWAATRSLPVEERPLYSPSQGAWTFVQVRLAGGRIGAHEVKQPGAAEGSV
jgi:hypothetical protein